MITENEEETTPENFAENFVDAAMEKDTVSAQKAFNTAVLSKIGDQMDSLKYDTAQAMFADTDDEGDE